MKSLKKYILAILTLAVFSPMVSCYKEYIEPNSLSDISWMLSGVDRANRPIVYLKQDEMISFMDVSQGALTHYWDVSEDGTHMLRGPIVDKDLGLDYYIDPSIPHLTTDKVIGVLFKKEGMHTVRLRNTFAEQVTFYYKPDVNQPIAESINSEFVDGEHVIDTTFQVEVFGSILVPNAKVYRDADLTDEVPTGYYANPNGDVNGDGNIDSIKHKVTIKLGETLYFKDNSSYKPNLWSWYCNAAGMLDGEHMGEVIPMTFNVPSSVVSNNQFTVTLKVTREASDTGTEKFIPTASAKTLAIPLSIVVEETAAEEELDYEVRISDLSQTVLQVVLNNAIFSEDQFATLEGRDEVIAGITAVAGSVSYDCKGVSLDEDKPYILNLHFDDEENSQSVYFYNTKTNTVSIDATSQLLIEGFADGIRSLYGTDLDVSSPVVDNVLPASMRDFTQLYNTIVARYPELQTMSVEAVNKDVRFKRELQSYVFCEPGTNGETYGELSLVEDPEDSSKKVLQLDVIGAAVRLRIGDTFNIPTTGLYRFTGETMYVPNPDRPDYPYGTTTDGMTIAVCDPYPASFKQNFFFVSQDDYDTEASLAAIKISDILSAGGSWYRHNAQDRVAFRIALNPGYGQSFSINCNAIDAGSILFRNLRITNERE